MKRRLFTGLTALALLLSLPACAGQNPPQTETTPPPETTPAQAETAPPPSEELGFQVLPVTEEGIRTLYGWEGFEVRKITPWEGDFLVECGYANDPGFSLLYWVFGATGRRVQLTAMDQFASYEVIATGQVRCATTGQSAAVPWKGLPETYTVRVLGDENGVIDPNWAEVETSFETTWLDPAQPLSIGATEEGPVYPDRYEQLYDARIDADGLSFSFIPNGDSLERFQSFFPAATTIPGFVTSYDPEGRVFTLRLYNTSLESGGAGNAAEEWVGEGTYPEDLYPYSFPAGSLGRDSHFLTDVTIREDGEDVVVSAVLTERAYRFTVEGSNLGFDNIPSFRLVFREENPDLDGWD